MQNNNAQVNELFKDVYGDTKDLIPADFLLSKLIPWKESQMVGQNYVEDAILTAEVGITYAGSTADAFDINPAVAGTVKQVSIAPSQTVLPSILPWGMISRSVGSSKAFLNATKHVVKNNLKSHQKFVEIARVHGQATQKLGYVAYNTSTYRGASFTAGTGTLTLADGSTLAFTNGINASAKAILLRPGYFAAGVWCGMENVWVQEIDANGLVVAEGKLVAVDAELGYITVDFTPIAAGSATSHRLCFKGMPDSKDMMGIDKVLSTLSGNLFGIPVANYSLWKPVNVNCASAKFSFELLSNGIASAVNRGGLGDGSQGDGDLTVLVNPRSWARLIQTEAGKRSYDSSYETATSKVGAEAIEFHTEAGKATIVSYRLISEGFAYGLHLQDWSRSGSAQVSFRVPGMGDELVTPLERQAGYSFKSFGDEYIFCNPPVKSIRWHSINDEAA